MASFLDRQMKRAIAQGFKGRLLKGRVRRVTAAAANEFGDAEPEAPEYFKCEGIRENFDAAYAAKAGIPVTDVKIMLIAGLVAIEPRQGDKVELRGQWYDLKRVLSVDPAGATYTFQATQIPEGTP